MTKAEIIAALEGYPDDTRLAVLGRPLIPDGDRRYEFIDRVVPLSLEENSPDLSALVWDALRNGANVLSFEADD